MDTTTTLLNTVVSVAGFLFVVFMAYIKRRVKFELEIEPVGRGEGMKWKNFYVRIKNTCNHALEVKNTSLENPQGRPLAWVGADVSGVTPNTIAPGETRYESYYSLIPDGQFNEWKTENITDDTLVILDVNWKKRTYKLPDLVRNWSEVKNM